jgi:hypothetical protein
MPAQVAAALSPNCFFTDSNATFTNLDADAKRLRSQAVQNLGRARSPYADIAKKRAIRAGYKNSTFPWVDTATALLDHVGRCWLVSEIAIIGAASPLLSGHTKNPGATAFGTTGHPSELLAQTRAHADDAAWWRHQLDTVDDELGRAEWTLALWSVASGNVVSELLASLESTIDALPATLGQNVLRAATRMAFHGWRGKGRVAPSPADTWLAGLTAERNGLGWWPSGAVQSPNLIPPRSQPAPQPALLSVARSERWLKVDTQPTYQ